MDTSQKNRANTTLLVVDSSHELIDTLKTTLPSTDTYEVEYFIQLEEFERRINTLQNGETLFLILGYTFPEKTAKELILELKQKGIEYPYIILSSQETETQALELLQLGAENYVLTNPVALQALPVHINRALKNTPGALKANQQTLLERIELLESLPQLVWTCLAEGPCDYLSKQWIEYTGIPEKPQLEYGWLEQLHPDDREPTVIEWQKKVVSGEAFNIQFRIRRFDGVYNWFQTRAVPLRDSSGTIVKWLGSNTNAQETVEKDQALRVSEERRQLALDGAGDGIWDWDLINNTVFYSDSWEKMLGFEKGTVPHVMDTFSQRVYPDDLEGIFQEADRYFNREIPEYEYEFRMVHLKGNIMWIRARGKALFGADGKATRFIGTISDFTKHKDIELELIQAKTEAELANKAKSNFIANVSHEIRTPMNSILGMADLLLQEQLSPGGQEYINIMRRNGDSLLNVINSVLNMSKMESGLIELKPGPFKPRQLLETVVMSLSPVAHQKGLTLIQKITDNIPGVVLADAAKIQQILINLLGNAIKFTDNGSITLTMSASLHENVLEFSVHDTGPGIPPEQQDRIFEVFTQVDSSVTRAKEGTGLGLAISKHLVELMDGTIRLESEPGKGSTFFFSTSFKPARRESEILNTPNLEPLTSPIEVEPLSVLLVEDNLDSQLLVKAYLKDSSHKLTLADNGEIAFEKFKNNDFDLVLMDGQMPVMGGHEATRLIRDWERSQKRNPTRIIALTAHAFDDDVKQSLAAGCDHHMTKPFGKKVLLDTIAGNYKTDSLTPD